MKDKITRTAKVILLLAITAVLLLPAMNAHAAGSKVKKIKITNIRTVQSLIEKKSVTLKVKTTPKVSAKRLKYISSNKKIATVSKRGKVTAKKAGTVYITVQTKDKKKRTRVKITIYKRIQTMKITGPLMYPYMQRGEKVQLKADIRPAKACQKVTWTTSNKAVVSITSGGMATARKKGRAVITAKAADGSNRYVKHTIYVTSLHDQAAKAIAHRGYSAKAPENTRAAFMCALSASFGAMECDVRRTKDGVFVISHDNSLNRLFGVNQLISKSNYKDIQHLKAVAGNGINNYPDQSLLTLEEFMDIAAAGTKRITIELKSVWSQKDTNWLYDMISDYGINDRIEIISFQAEELLRVKKAIESYEERHREESDEEGEDENENENETMTENAIVIPPAPSMNLLSISPSLKDEALGNKTPVQWALAQGFGLSLYWETITPGIVQKVHAAGLPVVAWTVDRFDVAYHLLHGLKVDRVTSNADIYRE